LPPEGGGGGPLWEEQNRTRRGLYGTLRTGATNSSTEIADAYMDSFRWYAITGRDPGVIGRGAFQETDGWDDLSR